MLYQAKVADSIIIESGKVVISDDKPTNIAASHAQAASGSLLAASIFDNLLLAKPKIPKFNSTNADIMCIKSGGHLRIDTLMNKIETASSELDGIIQLYQPLDDRADTITISRRSKDFYIYDPNHGIIHPPNTTQAKVKSILAALIDSYKSADYLFSTTYTPIRQQLPEVFSKIALCKSCITLGELPEEARTALTNLSKIDSHGNKRNDFDCLNLFNLNCVLRPYKEQDREKLKTLLVRMINELESFEEWETCCLKINKLMIADDKLDPDKIDVSPPVSRCSWLRP